MDPARPARPGAGGEHNGALVVRVSAPAVAGRATKAALTAVVGAPGVRRHAVTLTAGAFKPHQDSRDRGRRFRRAQPLLANACHGDPT
jgi:uncharacterized protein YggU (UPF0235/DUF167 family)